MARLPLTWGEPVCGQPRAGPQHLGRLCVQEADAGFDLVLATAVQGHILNHPGNKKPPAHGNHVQPASSCSVNPSGSRELHAFELVGSGEGSVAFRHVAP